MKTRLFAALLGAAVLTSARATVVSTGAFPYPVNMGPDADPGRIPVGLIPCESNHGYGLLELITTPVSSVPGGWRWEGGTELNGNLPSAFGISLQSHDGTGATDGPVRIHIRKQTVPAYSPYTKEQVLLATIRCLLDTVRATPKQPLEIQISTDDPADEALRRFAGGYLTAPVNDGDDFEKTPLPGCTTHVDRNGVREIVFTDDGTPVRPSGNRRPLWMPFPVEGDSDEEFLLLPLWTGNGLPGDRLKLLGRPWPVVQDKFNPAIGNPDGNLLTRRDEFSHFRVKRSGEMSAIHVGVNLRENRDPVDGMALLCWAAVLTEHPTEDTPLEITLRMDDEVDPRFLTWVTDHGWEQISIANDVGIRTTFVWNPETGSLTKGRIPKFRIDRNPDGGWQVSDRAAYQRAMKTMTEEGARWP